MSLMDQTLQVTTSSVPRPKEVLRDKFCKNVHDQAMRIDLLRLVRQDSSLSILDVRSEAIHWVEGQPN